MQRLPSLLHREAEAGRHRRPGRALRAAVRPPGQEVSTNRLDALRAVKLRALVEGFWTKDGSGRGEPSLFPGGSALLGPGPDPGRAWVLIDDGEVPRFGAALAWAWREGVDRLDVLVEEAVPGAAGVIARRAAEMARPPAVWVVDGRDLRPAEPAGIPSEPPPDGPAEAASELIRAHGGEAVIEHGVLRAEVLGLEVARMINGRLEVGVGRHDRHARQEMRPGEDPGHALDEAVAAVRTRRRPGAARHPANTLARARWLRSVVCARPALVGAARLEAVAPPLPWFDLPEAGAAPCVGTDEAGGSLVVVCSTGVDPDLVPTAADSRRLHRPEGRLVIVVPEGDDLPVTRELAAALARPAEVRTVPRSWDELPG